MFKLIFPSKTLQYMCLMSVTVTLQLQTVAEKTKGHEKNMENCMTDSLQGTRYFVKYSTFCHHFIFVFLTCKQNREVQRLLRLLCEL